MSDILSDRIAIAPSILASNFLRLDRAVAGAEAGRADRLHIDVMDGRFVPNITIGPPIVAALRSATTMMLEVHLMIVEPERYVPAFSEAGADLIIVHIEASPHIYRTVQQIHDLGRRAGVAMNPGTPAISVREVLCLADLILVMTVNPGFGGQKFIHSVLPKLHDVSSKILTEECHAEVEVDGGVSVETAPLVVAAGARVLVAGTSIYGVDGGVEAAIHELRKSARTGLHGRDDVRE